MTAPSRHLAAAALAVAWLAGLTRELLSAPGKPLQRFDEGIELANVTWLQHGVLSIGDVYSPYGFANGLPTLLAGPWADEMLVVRGQGVLLCWLAIAAAVLAGWRMAGPAAAALVLLLSQLLLTARYAAPFGGLILAALLVLRASRHHGDGEVRAALTTPAGRRALALALVPAAVGSLWKPEFVAYLLIAAVALLVLTPATHRAAFARSLAVAPLAAIGVHLLAVVIAGGPRHLLWWTDYAVTGYPVERAGGGRDWWAGPELLQQLVLDGRWSRPDALVVGTFYAAGLPLIVLAIRAVRRVRAGEGPLAAVGSGSGAPLLLALWAVVAALQLTSREAGLLVDAMPLIAAAVASIAVASARGRVLPTAALAVMAVCVWGTLEQRMQLDEARGGLDALSAARADDVRQLAGLRGIRLNPEEEFALGPFQALWRARHAGEDTFVTNARTGDAQANEPVLYGLLDAAPTAWPGVFDPGLADRPEVQREVVEDLCADGGPVVSLTGAYEREPYPVRETALLDQVLALGWDDTGGTRLHRILERPAGAGACPVDPRRVAPETVRRRRDVLLAQDRLPAAGALAVLGLETARRAGRPPAADDLAVAALGGFRVDPRGARSPGLLAALRAAMEGRGPTPVERASILSELGAPEAPDEPTVALVLVAAVLDDPQATPQERGLAGGLGLQLATGPRALAEGLRQASAVVPLDQGTLDDLRARGAAPGLVARTGLEAAIRDSDDGRARGRLLETLASYPVDPDIRGEVLERYAAAAATPPDCAARARRAAAEIPGWRRLAPAIAPDACPELAQALPTG